MMKKGSLLVALVITAIAITACGCQSESTNNATSNAVNDNKRDFVPSMVISLFC